MVSIGLSWIGALVILLLIVTGIKTLIEKKKEQKDED